MLGQLRQYLKSSMSSVQIPTTKILSVKFVTAALKNHYKSNSYPDASMILTHVSFRKQNFSVLKDVNDTYSYTHTLFHCYTVSSILLQYFFAPYSQMQN